MSRRFAAIGGMRRNVRGGSARPAPTAFGSWVDRSAGYSGLTYGVGAVALPDGSFVVLSDGENKTFTGNGVTATPHNQSAMYGAAAYSSDLGQMLALAYGSAAAGYSADGITFTASGTPQLTVGDAQPCWAGGSIQRWVTAGSTQSPTNVCTSPTGAVFTPRTTPTGKDYRGCLYDPVTAKIYVFGNSTTSLLKSSDGVTFTETANAGVTFQGSFWAVSPAGVFCVGTTTGYAYSLDGTTWTNVAAVSGKLCSVVWCGDMSAFILGGEAVIGYVLASDLGTYHAMTLPSTAADWWIEQIAYSSTLRRVLATSDNDGVHTVMTCDLV